MKFNAFVAAAVTVLSLAATGLRAEPRPVALSPIQHSPATLELRAADGSVSAYTPAELETFPTYRIETTTPWREEVTVFEGVLLADVLARHGLDDAASIRVVAENDFAATIEREVWQFVPLLIATRVNGRAHSRRERGPIQFVVEDSVYNGSSVVGERHLVWMAASIESGG